jgi:hypothetical protein
VAVGYADLGCAVLLRILSAVLVIMARKFWKREKTDYTESSMCACVFSYLGSVVSFAVALGFAYNCILELANPEFFALSEILKVAGK